MLINMDMETLHCKLNGNHCMCMSMCDCTGAYNSVSDQVSYNVMLQQQLNHLSDFLAFLG